MNESTEEQLRLAKRFNGQAGEAWEKRDDEERKHYAIMGITHAAKAQGIAAATQQALNALNQFGAAVKLDEVIDEAAQLILDARAMIMLEDV